MDLEELRIAEFSTLLVNGRNSRAVADRGSRAAAVYLARATRSEDDNISRERNDLIGVHVLGNDTTADTVFVLDDLDEFPELVLLDAALDFPATDLLIKSIEELLTRRGTGKHRALVLLAAEVTEIQHTFCRTRERHAHAVEHLDELRSCLDHAFDCELVSEEVAAVNRIIEMLIDGIMLTLRIHAGIDAALGTERMGTLYRAIGKEVYFSAALADLQRSHEPERPPPTTIILFSGFLAIDILLFLHSVSWSYMTK